METKEYGEGEDTTGTASSSEPDPGIPRSQSPVAVERDVHVNMDPTLADWFKVESTDTSLGGDDAGDNSDSATDVDSDNADVADDEDSTELDDWFGVGPSNKADDVDDTSASTVSPLVCRCSKSSHNSTFLGSVCRCQDGRK